MPSRISWRVARGVRPSPHTFSRGNWVFSSSDTCRPRRARWVAVADPAGPAPTTITSDSMARNVARYPSRVIDIATPSRRCGRRPYASSLVWGRSRWKTFTNIGVSLRLPGTVGAIRGTRPGERRFPTRQGESPRITGRLCCVIAPDRRTAAPGCPRRNSPRAGRSAPWPGSEEPNCPSNRCTERPRPPARTGQDEQLAYGIGGRRASCNGWGSRPSGIDPHHCARFRAKERRSAASKPLRRARPARRPAPPGRLRAGR